MICNICRSHAASSFKTLDSKTYWSCNVCGCKYLDKLYFIDSVEEEQRYLEHNNDIKDKEHKDNVAEVLRLSVANHYSQVDRNTKIILKYLENINKESNFIEEFKLWSEKLNYYPDVLAYKGAIVKTLYKHEKYYLDK